MDKGFLFNLELLVLKPEITNRMIPVSSLAILEGSGSKSFASTGLFSTEIFGNVGTKRRNQQFSYINLNVKVLHPLIYKHLMSLRKFYLEIVNEKAYATFDNKLGDFVPATMDNGSTGYDFFFKNYTKIKHEATNSEERQGKIKLLKKYKPEEVIIDKYLVYPAGLRDYTVDDLGHPSSDEVNNLYTSLLVYVNTLKSIDTSVVNLEDLNKTRLAIQMATVKIYDHFIDLLDGKKKFIQGKWTSRSVDGTRNVITPSAGIVNDLTTPEANTSFNKSVMGLFQYAKSITPISIHHIQNKFSKHIFTEGSMSANLINKNTLTSTFTLISTKTKDIWTSEEGLIGVINRLTQDVMRGEYIVVEGHYLALVYDDGQRIKLVIDTNQLPDNIDKKHLRPITYYEMLYLAVYETIGRYPGLFTRYPITGQGSVYPSYPFVKTTIKGRTVDILDDSWNIVKRVYDYPKQGEGYFNTLSPHPTRIGRLGADYDGDKCSWISLYTEESIKEVEDTLKSRAYYVTPDGSMLYSADDKIIKGLMYTLTY